MTFDHPQVEVLFNELQEKCDKATEYMKSEFSNMRAGRANPKILDKVVVEYYGTMTPLNQMGNISISDPRSLVVSLWDKSALGKVEKAILAANLGLTPQNNGEVIRLTFPIVTEERRKELVKSVKKLSEETKVVVRNARRDLLDGLKKLKNDKVLSEDAVANYEKIAERAITHQMDYIDQLTKEKETDVMSV